MVATMCLTKELSIDGDLGLASLNAIPVNAVPKVLVVDDDCDIRLLVAQHLRRQGLDVLTASDGAEALTMLENNRPDLVLLDIMMPRVDGFEVLSDLRLHGHRVPIVLLSALGRPSDVSHGLELGADDYMVKPFSRSDLLQSVRKFVDTSRLDAAAAAMQELAAMQQLVLADPVDGGKVL
jgi:DNA-binding response OmpR family regulator